MAWMIGLFVGQALAQVVAKTNEHFELRFAGQLKGTGNHLRPVKSGNFHHFSYLLQ